MQALLIAESLQELGLQNWTKTNKIGKVVVIFSVVVIFKTVTGF